MLCTGNPTSQEVSEPASPQEPSEPPQDHPWADWPDEQLLELRLCDLRLSLESSSVLEQIREVERELSAQNLNFKPHFWLAEEWFSPDGVPGVAVPFYLAHPRLAKLEMSQMLEVEGGTPESCRRILRHELGHAIENAYRIRRYRKRQAVFGRSTQSYPKYYTPRPYSKSYVQHLDMWYAQSHPDEDFAETFAVWLTPNSQWRERYADWPALKKLEYMDSLMKSLADARPSVTTKERTKAETVRIGPSHVLRQRFAPSLLRPAGIQDSSDRSKLYPSVAKSSPTARRQVDG